MASRTAAPPGYAKLKLRRDSRRGQRDQLVVFVNRLAVPERQRDVRHHRQLVCVQPLLLPLLRAVGQKFHIESHDVVGQHERVLRVVDVRLEQERLLAQDQPAQAIGARLHREVHAPHRLVLKQRAARECLRQMCYKTQVSGVPAALGDECVVCFVGEKIFDRSERLLERAHGDPFALGIRRGLEPDARGTMNPGPTGINAGDDQRKNRQRDQHLDQRERQHPPTLG